MKKSLMATLVVAPLLSLSSLAFAADPASAKPTLLTATQMDSITAGVADLADIGQINIGSPVTIVQINVLTAGSNNFAEVFGGNFGPISQ